MAENSSKSNELAEKENSAESNPKKVEEATESDIGTQKEPNHFTANKASKTGQISKVTVILKAAGDTPIIKQARWEVEGAKTLAYVSSFIKKLLPLDSSDSLFLYINQSFAPSPDQTLKNLFECFGSDGKLVLHYSRTHAWG